MMENYKISPTLRLLGKRLHDRLGESPQETSKMLEELLDRLEQAEKQMRAPRAHDRKRMHDR